MDEASHSYPSFSEKRKFFTSSLLKAKVRLESFFFAWTVGMLHSVREALVSLLFFFFVACQDKRGPFLRLGVQSLLPDCSTLSWFLHSCSKKDASYWRATSAQCRVWTPGRPRGRLGCRLAWRLEKKWKKMLLVACTSWYLLLSLSHNTKKGKKNTKRSNRFFLIFFLKKLSLQLL